MVLIYRLDCQCEIGGKWNVVLVQRLRATSLKPQSRLKANFTQSPSRFGAAILSNCAIVGVRCVN